jgi:hypothetical protein
MPTKTGPEGQRPARTKGEPIEIVVRRGAVRRFEVMKTRTADLDVVVTWDRRETDRRSGDERSVKMEVPRNRRASDRRQKAPFTWDLADFVVVAPAESRRSARRKPSKKDEGR